jgi:hypothetical protein
MIVRWPVRQAAHLHFEPVDEQLMVSAGLAHDLPQQVSEDGVGGLSCKHGVLHQNEQRSYLVLGVQSV